MPSLGWRLRTSSSARRTCAGKLYFRALIGEKKTNGALGKTIDILAVFATVAGVTTSLGLGVLQINSGLGYLFGIPSTLLVQIAIIAVITVVYIWSAVSGIEKGIKLISDANLYIAFGLWILAVLVGPKGRNH